MEECPFCKILAEKSSRMLREYDYAFVIFSDPRLMPGHLLIISKRHVEKIAELPAEEKAEIFQLAEHYQEEVLKKIASGCDIRQNYRPFVKQGRLKINHLHFHIQPRENEDPLYTQVQRFETDMFKPLPEDELQKYKKLLS